MWGLRKDNRSECWEAMELLEAGGITLGNERTLEEIMLGLPAPEREHVLACGNCRAAYEERLEARELLAPMAKKEMEPGPFFVNRVMAAIRARGEELERSTRAWAAVPKLASRLAGVALLLLLVTGTLLYTSPRRYRTTQPAVEPANAIFEDNAPVPTSKDDVLVSLLESGK
jgi:hypothetical protein